MLDIYAKIGPRRKYFKVKSTDNDINEATEQKHFAKSGHFR